MTTPDDPYSQYAYYTFQPRPDQPERGDQQTAFIQSRHHGVTYFITGNGAGGTTSAIVKAIEFLMTTPPPTKDAAFWFLANSLEMCQTVIWKEKMCQHGHLLPSEVDEERISWYRPNQNLPFIVPLKPWPGRPGKNWSMHFKAYSQGRAQLQGAALHGFMFCEQFPESILAEVLRGCRESSYLGAKIAEYTPVDPSLSSELRDHEENGTLPEGDAIYRANTACAVEAGHVSAAWFKQFYGMVSEQMLPARLEGKWSSFEGSIFPEFNTDIHCVEADWEPTPGMDIRRGIDWGFSLDHPLVCLWAARNSIGQWFVFDEYWNNDTGKTVVDHLCSMEDQHPSPKDYSPYWGVAWCDHNLDCLRIAGRLEEYAPGYPSLNCQMARKSVTEGIETMKFLLKPTITVDPDKPSQPRLFISKRCRHLISEMRTYRYHKTMGTGPNAQAAVDEPVKIKDDAPDALRYIVHSEAEMSGMTPSTVARQHDPIRHGIHVESSRFSSRGRR